MARVDRRELGAIFVGGAAGALLRVSLGIKFTPAASAWPWDIFIINVSGSVALASFATRLQERLPQSTYRRPLNRVPWAYTTFSTMQVEVLAMGAANAFVSLLIGFGAAALGRVVGTHA